LSPQERTHAQEMQPGKIYNVRRDVWYTHTLSPDAMVLIVENRDTTYDNSPFCALTQIQRKQIIAASRAAGL
jgi:hypothetical protein